MEPRLLSGRASSVGELRRTWPLSSTKVEEKPVRTGVVMVEGMVGGSNGRKEGERGIKSERQKQNVNANYILLRRKRLTKTSKTIAASGLQIPTVTD